MKDFCFYRSNACLLLLLNKLKNNKGFAFCTLLFFIYFSLILILHVLGLTVFVFSKLNFSTSFCFEDNFRAHSYSNSKRLRTPSPFLYSFIVLPYNLHIYFYGFELNHKIFTEKNFCISAKHSSNFANNFLSYKRKCHASCLLLFAATKDSLSVSAKRLNCNASSFIDHTDSANLLYEEKANQARKFNFAIAKKYVSNYLNVAVHHASNGAFDHSLAYFLSAIDVMKRIYEALNQAKATNNSCCFAFKNDTELLSVGAPQITSEFFCFKKIDEVKNKVQTLIHYFVSTTTNLVKTIFIKDSKTSRLALRIALRMYDEIRTLHMPTNAALYTMLIARLAASNDVDTATKLWNDVITDCDIEHLCEKTEGKVNNTSGAVPTQERENYFTSETYTENQDIVCLDTKRKSDEEMNKHSKNSKQKNFQNIDTKAREVRSQEILRKSERQIAENKDFSKARKKAVVSILDLKEFQQHNLKIDLALYNAFIYANAKNNKLEKALLLLTQMQKKHGILPDRMTYHSLMGGCARNGDVERAEMLFKEMCRLGFLPNNRTFSILIDAFANKKDIKSALQIFNFLTKEGYEPNIFVYGALIKACVSARDVRTAIRIVTKMKETSVDMNVVTWTNIIDLCCKKRFYKLALIFFFEMIASGIQPNVNTCTVLLNGALQSNLYSWCCSILSYMENLSIQLNSSTITSLLTNQIHNANHDDLLIQEILSKGGKLNLNFKSAAIFKSFYEIVGCLHSMFKRIYLSNFYSKNVNRQEVSLTVPRCEFFLNALKKNINQIEKMYMSKNIGDLAYFSAEFAFSKAIKIIKFFEEHMLLCNKNVEASNSFESNLESLNKQLIRDFEWIDKYEKKNIWNFDSSFGSYGISLSNSSNISSSNFSRETNNLTSSLDVSHQDEEKEHIAQLVQFDSFKKDINRLEYDDLCFEKKNEAQRGENNSLNKSIFFHPNRGVFPIRNHRSAENIFNNVFNDNFTLPKTKSYWNCTSQNNQAISKQENLKDVSLFDNAIRLYENMKTNGLIIDEYAYNSFIDACATSGNITVAADIFRSMRMEGMYPNYVTYTTLLKACVNTNSVSLAEDIFKGMQIQHEKFGKDCAPNELSFFYLMNVNYRAGRYQRVLELYETLKKSNVTIKRLSATFLVRFFCDNKMLNQAAEIHEYLTSSRVELSPHTKFYLRQTLREGGRYDLIK